MELGTIALLAAVIILVRIFVVLMFLIFMLITSITKKDDKKIVSNKTIKKDDYGFDVDFDIVNLENSIVKTEVVYV